MIHVTCRLTAKNRDQLRNPTLGNRVWATFLLTLLKLPKFSITDLCLSNVYFGRVRGNCLGICEDGRQISIY